MRMNSCDISRYWRPRSGRAVDQSSKRYGSTSTFTPSKRDRQSSLPALNASTAPNIRAAVARFSGRMHSDVLR